MKKKLPIVLFLILGSCSKVSPPQWEFKEVKSYYEPNCSSQLVFMAANEFRGLTVEIIRTSSGQRIYLSIFSLSFPKSEEDPNKTLITFQWKEEENEFLAERLEGGQKVLLPKEAQVLLIDLVREGNEVTISAGRFQTTVSSLGFF